MTTGIVVGIGVSVALTNNPAYALLGTLGCALGSVFPDIDAVNSKINNKVKITKVIGMLFPHRGIIHTPFCMEILHFFTLQLAIRYNVPLVIPYMFRLGYFLHLLQDTVTLEGISWLVPFTKKKIKIIGSKNRTFYVLFSFVSSILIIIFHFLNKGVIVNFLQGG